MNSCRSCSTVLVEHDKYIIRRVLQTRPTTKCVVCRVENDLNLVFTQQNGKPIDADNLIKRRFHKILKKADVKQIRFHDLRHTYASLLLANGAPMKYVQHQLGHSSITMTMDLYTHLLPEVNDKCVNLLNSIVNQAVKLQEEVRRFGT